MVDLEEANKLFWHMVEHGWNEDNYAKKKRQCHSFVYNFVCRLLDGKCPEKEKWPQNFLEFDANNGDGSVFVEKDLLMPDGKFF